MPADRTLLPIAAVLLLLAASLHGYQNFYLSDRSSAVLFVWTLFPYALCLMVLAFSKSRIPAICAMSVALAADAIAHYVVFVHSANPADDWLLTFVPLWSAILFVPLTLLISRAMVRDGDSISTRLMRGAKWTFGIVALFVCAFAAYYGYWTYQYNSAESAANAFCASATIGSEVSTAITQAETAGIRHGVRTSADPAHVFEFRGPIFNSFACELSVSAGKVTSTNVVQPSR